MSRRFYNKGANRPNRGIAGQSLFTPKGYAKRIPRMGGDRNPHVRMKAKDMGDWTKFVNNKIKQGIRDRHTIHAMGIRQRAGQALSRKPITKVKFSWDKED